MPSALHLWSEVETFHMMIDTPTVTLSQRHLGHVNAADERLCTCADKEQEDGAEVKEPFDVLHQSTAAHHTGCPGQQCLNGVVFNRRQTKLRGALPRGSAQCSGLVGWLANCFRFCGQQLATVAQTYKHSLREGRQGKTS